MDGTQRQIVADAWALATIVTHTPQDDTYGRTCDERGCIVCNGGMDAHASLAIDLASLDRFDPEEAADALDELAEWLRGQ